MITTHKTNEGFAVGIAGELAATVLGAAATEHKAHVKTGVPYWHRDLLPRGQWRVHFTGRHFTEAELAAVVATIAKYAE